MVSAVVVGAWAIVELNSRRARLVVDLGVIAAAVGVITVAGMLVYQLRFGVWDLFTPSLTAFESVSGDTGNVFRSPTLEWTKFHLQLYVPLLALAAFAGANCRSLRRVAAWEITSFLMLLGLLGALAADQFLRNGTSLETYYYSSCLAPFVALSLAATLSSLWRTATLAEWKSWALVSLIVLVPLSMNIFAPDLEIDRFPAVLIMLVLCAGLAFTAAQMGVSQRPGRTWAPVAAVLATACVITSTTLMLNAPPRTEPRGSLFHPHYENALGNRSRTGLDIYRLSFDMIAAVPPLISKDGTVFVWNNPVRDPYTGTLTGTLVGFSSTFQSLGDGMPAVSDWLLSRIPYEDIDVLILLDKDPAQIRAGVDALAARGVDIVGVEDKVLSSGAERYYLKLLDVGT